MIAKKANIKYMYCKSVSGEVMFVNLNSVNNTNGVNKIFINLLSLGIKQPVPF